MSKASILLLVSALAAASASFALFCANSFVAIISKSTPA
jgi:hypothetical protein